MKKELSITVAPEVGADMKALRAVVARKLGVAEKKLTHVEILRQSIDARRQPIRMQLQIMAYVGTPYEETPITLPDYQEVGNAEPIIIVGAGPAGLFAALRCLERGYMPIVLERGKDVRERIQDLQAINTRLMTAKYNTDFILAFGLNIVIERIHLWNIT